MRLLRDYFQWGLFYITELQLCRKSEVFKMIKKPPLYCTHLSIHILIKYPRSFRCKLTTSSAKILNLWKNYWIVTYEIRNSWSDVLYEILFLYFSSNNFVSSRCLVLRIQFDVFQNKYLTLTEKNDTICY